MSLGGDSTYSKSSSNSGRVGGEKEREGKCAQSERERERMCDQEGNLAQWLIADSTCAASRFSATRLSCCSQTRRREREREHVLGAVLERPDWAVLAKVGGEKDQVRT